MFQKGQKVYAINTPSGVAVRTDSVVNDGYLNNVLTRVYNGGYIGTFFASVKGRDGFDWYVILFDKPIKTTFSQYHQGYVRSDVVRASQTEEKKQTATGPNFYETDAGKKALEDRLEELQKSDYRLFHELKKQESLLTLAKTKGANVVQEETKLKAIAERYNQRQNALDKMPGVESVKRNYQKELIDGYDGFGFVPVALAIPAVIVLVKWVAITATAALAVYLIGNWAFGKSAPEIAKQDLADILANEKAIFDKLQAALTPEELDKVNQKITDNAQGIADKAAASSGWNLFDLTNPINIAAWAAAALLVFKMVGKRREGRS